MKFADYMKLSKWQGVLLLISEGDKPKSIFTTMIKKQPKVCCLTWIDEHNEFIWESSTTLDECDAIYINFGWSDKTTELWKLLRIYSPKPVYIDISNLS